MFIVNMCGIVLEVKRRGIILWRSTEGRVTGV